jgi:MtN3 and saliva related transmembrane protein
MRGILRQWQLPGQGISACVRDCATPTVTTASRVYCYAQASMIGLPDAALDLIGSLAGLLTTAAFVPQVIKTWRSKSAEDLSLATLVTFTTGVVLWLMYGISLRSMPMIVANTVTFALNVLLLAMKWRYDSRA